MGKIETWWRFLSICLSFFLCTGIILDLFIYLGNTMIYLNLQVKEWMILKNDLSHILIILMETTS